MVEEIASSIATSNHDDVAMLGATDFDMNVSLEKFKSLIPKRSNSESKQSSLAEIIHLRCWNRDWSTNGTVLDAD